MVKLGDIDVKENINLKLYRKFTTYHWYNEKEDAAVFMNDSGVIAKQMKFNDSAILNPK